MSLLTRSLLYDYLDNTDNIPCPTHDEVMEFMRESLENIHINEAERTFKGIPECEIEIDINSIIAEEKRAMKKLDLSKIEAGKMEVFLGSCIELWLKAIMMEEFLIILSSLSELKKHLNQN